MNEQISSSLEGRAGVGLWLHIIRPGTLAASSSPVFIGLIVACEEVKCNWLIAAATLIAAVALQIASNLINDYYDFKKGLDRAGRLGPRRALAEGEVTKNAMLTAIGIDVVIAVSCGIFLTVTGGLPILIIGIAALLFAWLYTATPYSLSYLGIADLFVFLFYGSVASVGTTYLQTGQFSGRSFWLGSVCGLISMGILTVNNIRDRESDRQSGKRSIVVRFGKRFGELEYLTLFLLIIPCLAMAASKGLCYAVVVVGIGLYWQLRHTEGRAYNALLIRTGQANWLFAVLCLLEFLIFS